MAIAHEYRRNSLAVLELQLLTGPPGFSASASQIRKERGGRQKVNGKRSADAAQFLAAKRHSFGRPAGTTENSPALECRAAVFPKVRAVRTVASALASVRNGGEGWGEEARRQGDTVRRGGAPRSPTLAPFVPHGARETDTLQGRSHGARPVPCRWPHGAGETDALQGRDLALPPALPQP